MADIAWADVTAIAPELATYDVAGQAMLLAYVNTALAVGEFGGEESPSLKLARAYLAAHMATVGSYGASGETGPVRSESADGLSISYADAGSWSGEYGATAYGQAYRSLLRRAGIGLPMVIA